MIDGIAEVATSVLALIVGVAFSAAVVLAAGYLLHLGWDMVR